MSNKWNQNVIIFIARQKFVSFLKYIYYVMHTLAIYIHTTKSFQLYLVKPVKEHQTKKKRDKEIGKQTK